MRRNSRSGQWDAAVIAAEHGLSDVAALHAAIMQALLCLDAQELEPQPKKTDPLVRIGKLARELRTALDRLDGQDHARLVQARLALMKMDNESAFDAVEADLEAFGRLCDDLSYRQPLKRGRKANWRVRLAVHTLCCFWASSGGKVTQDFYKGNPMTPASKFVYDVIKCISPDVLPLVETQMELVVADMRADSNRL